MIHKDTAGIRVNTSSTQLGLVIKNKMDQFRIDLYSIDLTRLFSTISLTPTLSTIKNGHNIDFMLYLKMIVGD